MSLAFEEGYHPVGLNYIQNAIRKPKKKTWCLTLTFALRVRYFTFDQPLDQDRIIADRIIAQRQEKLCRGGNGGLASDA